MPRKKKGNKAALQKKLKQNQKKQQKKKQLDDEEEEKKAPEPQNTPLSGKAALLKKYDIRLGPEGYIPNAALPKSISIDEFSMVDPGGGRELLTKTKILIRENSIYGLVGKNGFGKTTLLKLMYKYEIEGFPHNIRMVLVNQEELVTDASIVKAVLQADDVREQLISTEDRINLMMDTETDEAVQDELNQILE